MHGVSSLKLAMKIWVKYLISAIFSPRGSWMSMHGGSPLASRSVLQTKLERANCDLKWGTWKVGPILLEFSYTKHSFPNSDSEKHFVILESIRRSCICKNIGRGKRFSWPRRLL